MLSDQELVKESLDSNFFYLRSLREYCILVMLSFYKDDRYNERLNIIKEKSVALGRNILTYIKGTVSKEALDYQIYFTKYTLPLEKLTEKLFNIEIATDITEKELSLTPSNELVKPETEFINYIIKMNEEALTISKDFINVITEIEEEISKNQLFSYLYKDFYNYMKRVIIRYQEELIKLNEKVSPGPVFAVNNEYDNNSIMYSISLYLRGLLDPSNRDDIEKLTAINERYVSLLKDYQNFALTPLNQRKLTTMSIDLLVEFRSLVESFIERLLTDQLYFIIAPLALNNFYTALNYFYYILIRSREYQTNFSM